MNVEITLESDFISVNGFKIYSNPKESNGELWIDNEIYWKDSRLTSFENIQDAIKYCLG